MAEPILASRLTQEHAHELAELEGAELEKMRATYGRARLEILERLSQAKADSFTAQHLRATLAQVSGGLREMVRKFEDHHSKSMETMLGISTRQTLKEIAFWENARGFGIGPIGGIQTAALRRINQGLLLNQFSTSMATYGSQLVGEVQRRLATHVAMRSSWQAMATDVAGRLSAHAITGAEWKAERIVRTEILNVLGAGQRAALEQAATELPGLKQQWDATAELGRGDRRTCVFCAALDGQIRPLEKPFSALGREVLRPPQPHPHCLPGDALVVPAGRITGQTERRFDGELVVLRTRSGQKLSITPNHPVLTRRGWVPAGEVQESDHVVRCSSQGLGALRAPHDQKVPTRVEDVARALRGALPVALEVDGAPLQFHGDGIAGEVAVVRTDRLLGDGLDAASLQELAESAFMLRVMESALLARLRDRALRLHRDLRAAAGRVGGLRELAALLGARELHPCPHGFGAVALAHPGLAETADYDVAAHTRRLGDRLHALAGQVALGETGHRETVGAQFGAGLDEGASDRSRAGSALARELLERGTGAVALDQVVRVERQAFSGHVYNLETTEGFYVAQGIVVHNCRCRLLPWRKEWTELEDEIIVQEPASVPAILKPGATSTAARRVAAGKAVAESAARAAELAPAVTKAGAGILEAGAAARKLLGLPHLDAALARAGLATEVKGQAQAAAAAARALRVEIDQVAQALADAKAGSKAPKTLDQLAKFGAHPHKAEILADLAKTHGLSPEAVQEVAKKAAADLARADATAPVLKALKAGKPTTFPENLTVLEAQRYGVLETAAARAGISELDEVAALATKADEAAGAFVGARRSYLVDAIVKAEGSLEATPAHALNSYRTSIRDYLKAKANLSAGDLEKAVEASVTAAHLEARGKVFLEAFQPFAAATDVLDQGLAAKKILHDLPLGNIVETAKASGLSPESAEKVYKDLQAALAKFSAERAKADTALGALGMGDDWSKIDWFDEWMTKLEASSLDHLEALAALDPKVAAYAVKLPADGGLNLPAGAKSVLEKKLAEKAAQSVTAKAAAFEAEKAAYLAQVESLGVAPPASPALTKAAKELALAQGKKSHSGMMKSLFSEAEKKLKVKAEAVVAKKAPWPKTQSGAPETAVLPSGKPVKLWKHSTGSNPGGFYRAADGEEWFLKFPKSVGQVGAEQSTASLARKMGLATKDYQTFAVGDSHVAIASPKASFTQKTHAQLAKWANQDELTDQFVHAAWTRNWDVVGMGADNLVEGAAGRLTTVDYGGSLLWRAQGTLKADGLTDVVGELESLRKGPNPDAVKVFGHLSDEQVAKRIQATLAKVTDLDIDQAVAAGNFEAADGAKIAKGLKARRDWLVEWAEKKLPKAKASPELYDLTPAKAAAKLSEGIDPAGFGAVVKPGQSAPGWLEEHWKAALGHDEKRAAQMARRLWAGTTELKKDQELAARFALIARQKGMAVLEAELSKFETTNTLLGALKATEAGNADVLGLLQRERKLAQALEAVKAKAAAEAAAQIAAAQAKQAAAKAAYEAEKAAFAEKVAAYEKAVAKLKLPERTTKTGEFTAAYLRRIEKWGEDFSRKGGTIGEKAAAFRQALEAERASHAVALRRVAELEAKAKAETWGYRARSYKRDATRLKREANELLRKATDAHVRGIEALAEEAGILPKRPKPPVSPGGLTKPARFYKHQPNREELLSVARERQSELGSTRVHEYAQGTYPVEKRWIPDEGIESTPYTHDRGLAAVRSFTGSSYRGIRSAKVGRWGYKDATGAIHRAIDRTQIAHFKQLADDVDEFIRRMPGFETSDAVPYVTRKEGFATDLDRTQFLEWLRSGTTGSPLETVWSAPSSSSSHAGTWHRNLVWKIRGKMSGTPINAISSAGGENEVLFPSGARFIVEGWSENQGTVYVDIREVFADE